jgi:hypothetical protein
MRTFFLSTLLLCATLNVRGAESMPATKPDVWAPLRGLVGQWEGESKGEPGVGKAARTYAFVLNHRFIQVNNKSAYPAQVKNPKGETHEDFGFISYDKAAKKFVFRQFHVEGFVNHYALESISADGKTIVFATVVNENLPPGFRGRETYRIVSDDEFVETFAMAEPGRDFATYSETLFRRKK